MDKELLKSIINKHIDKIIVDYEGEIERREDYLINKNYLLHNKADNFIQSISPIQAAKGEYLIFADGYLFKIRVDNKNKYLEIVNDEMYCVCEGFNFKDNCKFKEMLDDTDKAQAISFIEEQAIEFEAIQENKQN